MENKDSIVKKNYKKRINIFKDNKGGFTLIELLATIAVLSIIITIVLSVSLGVIKNSKEKSYQTTVVNIENIANDYLAENKSKLLFVDNEDGLNEYQCVSVQNLIDSGYFDSEIKKSLVREDRFVSGDDKVYLLRDIETKTIIKSKYIYYDENSDFNSLCAISLKTNGTIKINFTPSNWSHEKKIDIFYNLKNYLNVSNYKVNYRYEFEDSTKENIESGNLDYTKNLSLTVYEKGTLYTNIMEVCSVDDDCVNGYKIIESSSLIISQIDKDKPVITSNYTGDKIVKKTISIPIVINDVTSGVNREEIEFSKNINVYIGDTKIDVNSDEELAPSVLFNCVSCEMNSNEWKYNIIINNYTLRGKIKIEFLEDVFYDQANNSNEKTVFDTDIEFNNSLMVTFDPNGGSPSSSKDVWYGDVIGELPDVSYPGYKFKGWSIIKTTPGSSCSSIINENTVIVEDKTYYACWELNKVTIKYNVNSGIIKNSTTSSSGANYSWSSLEDGLIYKNGSILTQELKYNQTMSSSGLVNYNNSTYMYITKTGYSALKNNEWICLAGDCTLGKTYSQSVVYSDDDFCDLTDEDCEVILGVNWTINYYTITFDTNGGTPSSIEDNIQYGEPVLENIPDNLTKDGYDLVGWSDEDTCDTYIDDNAIVIADTTYYACWKAYKIKVQYHMNGGYFSSNDTNKNNGIGYSGNYITRNGTTIYSSYNYGTTNIDLTNPDNASWVDILKTGYSPKTGVEWKKSDGTTFSDSGGVNSSDLCDASKGDCTVTLYVNWAPNTYTVSYNSGSCIEGTISSQTAIYDSNFSVVTSDNITLKPQYRFLGWTTKSDGTDDGYGWTDFSGIWKLIDGENGVNDSKLQLYPICEKYKIKVQYHMNGGEFAGTTSSVISNSGDYITKNGSRIVASYDYGKTNIDLANPDNPSYINISLTGHAPKVGYEWKKSDGTAFSDSGGVNSSDLCDASKGDCTVTLYVNWDKSEYTITYNANGGTPSETIVNKVYGDTLDSFPEPSYVGFTLFGWSSTKTTPGDTCSSTVTKSTVVTGNITYYTCWRKNTTNINLNVNGGILKEETAGNKWSTQNDDIYLNGNKYVHSIKYGSSMTGYGLADYNNSSWIYITRTGYYVNLDEAWVCLSGNCTKNVYDTEVNYSHSDICDASKKDCTITLGVNWIPNTYTIKFDANGGTSLVSSISRDYDTTLGTLPTATSSGFKFKGWSTTKTTPGTACSSTITSSTKVTGNVTYYACWEYNKINVSFDMNGGSFVETTTNKANNISFSGSLITNNNSTIYISYNYGTTGINLTDPDYASYVNITRTGYTPKSGAEWKKSDGTTFSDGSSDSKTYSASDLCDASKGDCSVTLYVNWNPNTYTINFDANGGTGMMNNMTCNYGGSCTLSENTFTKTGYNFIGWGTTSSTNTVTYKDEATFTYDQASDMTLYAVWDGQEFNINYNANSGTGTMSSTKCKYNESCTLSQNTFVKDGYYLVGWGLTSTATEAIYQDKQKFTYNKLEDTNLYAIWDTKPLRVYYNANGGGATGSYTLVDGWVSKDGSTYFYQTYEAGDTTDLYNYNYTGYIYLYKNGHYNDPDAAWNTESDGSGTSFSQSTEYKYSTLIKYADDLGEYYRLDLYANWYETTYGYYCFQATTGINCRSGMSTSYSYVSSLYSGYTYDSKYMGYYNGYYWYYSKNKQCYYAGGDNSRYEWVSYYGTSSSCYSSSGSSGGSSSGSSSSSSTGNCYCCFSHPYRTCTLSTLTGNTSTCSFWGTMTASQCSSYSD